MSFWTWLLAAERSASSVAKTGVFRAPGKKHSNDNATKGGTQERFVLGHSQDKLEWHMSQDGAE